ncbi:hypothetical protein DFH28DRAFT_1148347 [Melampsora americana]|nr:hypothetical protein DFH28DRAFT_1148347 [Melampsora americana]
MTDPPPSATPDSSTTPSSVTFITPNPSTTPISSPQDLISLFHPGLQPIANPVSLFSLLSNPSPLLYSNIHHRPQPAVQSAQMSSLENLATPISNSATTSNSLSAKGGRRSKQTTNDSSSKSSKAPTVQKSKQISWAKDLDKDGKSSLKAIVQWMGMTWGDQDSAEDSEWMCMEPSDLISTNYSAYRSGNRSKKECSERCANYLVAKGFRPRTWKGCKQQIELFESKFRAAEGWRRQTGAGILEQAKNKIADLQADPDNDFDEEQGEGIRSRAASLTNDVLRRMCRFYNDLVPIMGSRAANQPLATSKVFAGSQANDTSFNPSSIESNQNQSQSLEDSSHSTESIPFEENSDLNLTPGSSRASSPEGQVPNPEDQLPPIISPPSSFKLSTSNNTQRMPPARLPKTPTRSSQRPSTNKKREISKSVQSSLPSLSDLKELTEERRKEKNENQQLKDQMASSTQEFIAFLGSHMNESPAKNNNKRPLEENLTPETVTKKRAMDNEFATKQAELNLLKVDRQLQEEREALTNGSSKISKLDLARERVGFVAQLISAGMTQDEAIKFADNVLAGLG